MSLGTEKQDKLIFDFTAQVVQDFVNACFDIVVMLLNVAPT